MKKLSFRMMLLLVSCSVSAVGSKDLNDALRNLRKQLEILDESMLLVPAPLSPPKSVNSDQGPIITETQKNQLIGVLKDLDLEDEVRIEAEEEVSQNDFVRDLKIALNEIVKGFDSQTHEYIGYATYKKQFPRRFLSDFDAGLNLLKASAPQDPSISNYELLRPHLEKAVGRLPKVSVQEFSN